MTGQDLKNSILQLAIQGKLVPQDANDEPASVLLERIKAEKQKLINEKKIKKEKPLPEITDEEKPFEIPESWEWCRLGEIVSFVGGYAYKSHDFIEDSSYQVLRLGNVKNDYLKLNASPVFIPEDIALITEKYKCLPCDILITMTGTRKKRDYFFTYKVSENDCNLFINQRVGALRPYESLVSDYLRFSLKSETILQDVFQYETGTANQGNLGAENILKVLIPLPPLSEQHRIVAKIEELMPLVEEYDKAQKELDALNAKLPEALKKSILQEAIQGKLVPQDPNDEPASVLLQRIRKEKEQLVKDGKLKKKDLVTTPITDEEKPFEIPESWEWCRMGDVLSFINGRAYKKEELLDSGMTKVLRVGNFFTNDKWYYSDLELPDEKYCYKGDLLYAWSASFGPRIWEGEKSIFHYHIWNVKYNKKELYREYLYYFLLNDVNQIKKSTTGSTMIHVSMENMMPRLIPIPPLAEQHRIVSKIEDLFAQIEPLAKALSTPM